MNNIQFTNISDVRIVDSIIETRPKILSIQSNYISSTWCNINGCLRVLGKIIFSVNCPLACQLRKMNKIKTLNLIQPSIKMNLSSTLNINYIIELDAFTTVVSEGQENGDQIKVFVLYSLMENRGRTLSPFSVAVDNLSLTNITRLVDNSIIKSHMDIYKFNVVQAEVIMESSILNVTVLFTFTKQCMIDCQQIQINKLKNTQSIILNPIVIIYDGKIHFHNISLIGKFHFSLIHFYLGHTNNVLIMTSTIELIPTIENTIIPDNITIEMTNESILNTTKMIFEVNYKLDQYDLIIEGVFKVGPIIENLTLNDLTNMMQTTVSNDSNITVIVFNATIEIDDGNSTEKIVSSDSINYILRLIVYYIYAITCNICIEISNNAVYNEPQLEKLIEIRNATLIDISRPITVIKITSNSITTIFSSTTHKVSMSTVQLSTTNSNYNSTMKTTSSTVVHATIHPTTSQHQTTEHTSAVHYTSEDKTTTFHTTTLPHMNK
ncbi:unnamed protein product [Rotaria sordida]|uniref:Uncharacterized protein n=1 Tax=Rotaria sordida TaxID=392033 RepID=A0A818UY86_9BILA|nr:unnamed protein product [Rotaria sordida]